MRSRFSFLFEHDPRIKSGDKPCRKTAAHFSGSCLNAASYLLGRRLAWRRWTIEAAALDLAFSRRDVLAACAVRLEQQRTGPQASLLRYDDIDEHLPPMLPRVVPRTSQAFDRNDKDFPRRARNTIYL